MYKKVLKRFTCLLVVFMLIFSLAACSNNNDSDSGNSQDSTKQSSETIEQPVTLSIYHIWAGGDSKADIMTQVLDKFQSENKNIKLDIQTDSTDAFHNKIKTYAASGSMPDVTFVFSYSQLTPIAKSGSLADLTQIIEADQEWKDGLREGTLNAMSYDGKIYGTPMEGNAEGVFYNKALFDKIGASYPNNYDELKQVVEKFKANDIIPFALAGKESFPSMFLGNYLLERQAGYEMLEKILKGEEKFSNEDYLKGFSKFAELVQLGAFPEMLAAVSYDQARQMFIQGQAAMIVDGSWDIPQYDAEDKEEFAKNIEFAPFPSFDDGKGDANSVCKNIANGFAMSSELDGAKKEAAIKLLKYISVGDGAKVFVDNKVIMATNIQADPSKAGILLPKVSEVMNNTDSFQQYDNQMPGGLGPKYYEACQEMAVGGNPEDVLKKLDANAEREIIK